MSLFLALLTGPWTWNAVEVMGNRHVTSDELRRQAPIRVGAPYVEDVALWRGWCDDIARRYRFAYTECGAWRYFDGRAFFTVDVVEKGEEHRAAFRAKPTGSVPLADEAVRSTFAAVTRRWRELFEQGTPAKEHWEAGFLDYDEPELHRLVLELVRLVPPYRENVLTALAEDRNPATRMAAADLLNWALRMDDTALRAHRLLDDPESGVRNQLSRFLLHAVARVGAAELDPVIDSLLLQLDRPSHGDRNKAMGSLREIIAASPSKIPRIRAKGLRLLRHIEANVSMPNVKAQATELITLLQPEYLEPMHEEGKRQGVLPLSPVGSGEGS